MKQDDVEDSAIARLFNDPTAYPPRASRGCPDGETLEALGRGALTEAEGERLVDHLVSCPDCAAELRGLGQLELLAEQAAVALRRPGTPNAPAPRVRRSPRISRWLPLAAAVLVGAGVTVWSRRATTPAEDGALRSGQESAIETLVPKDAPLPRRDVVLKWKGAPTGSRYILQIASEDLATLARAETQTTQYRVDPAALAALPPRARILWRVEAVLPDGRVLDSRTFANRLAD